MSKLTMRLPTPSNLPRRAGCSALAAWLLLPGPLEAPVGSRTSCPKWAAAAQATLSLEDEYRIGRMIMRGLRDSGARAGGPGGRRVPAVARPAPGRASRTTATATSASSSVRDTRDQRVRLPGGFIGIHAGLLLETSNESELAGVLAHEVAHVTQRHIARGHREPGAHQPGVDRRDARRDPDRRRRRAVGADATMGSDHGRAEACAAQSQINYTREHEYEADRVGIGILVAAGFDPTSHGRLLRDHGPAHRSSDRTSCPSCCAPIRSPATRIAETRDRANCSEPAVHAPDSLELLADQGAHPRAAASRAGVDPRQYYASLTRQRSPTCRWRRSYGRGARRRCMAGAGGDAPSRRSRACATHIPRCSQFHTALGQAQLARGPDARRRSRRSSAHASSRRATCPVTVRYGEALLQAGRPEAGARGAARPVQQRAAVAGADPPHGHRRERRRRRRRRLLLHGRVPHHGRRPAARDQPARAGAVGARTSRACSAPSSAPGSRSCARPCRRSARARSAPNRASPPGG
ncbi:MAG: M48 family metalloprotease [Chromatiales bacterium]|nr:M48 family metalloprotease [Chromatiales bacterium]